MRRRPPRSHAEGMSILIRTTLRVAAVAALLTASYAAIAATAEKGDANIGAGLMLFALVLLVSAAWGLVDGLRHPLPGTIVSWAVVALVLAVGWILSISVMDAGDDPTMTWQELFTFNLELLPFLVALVVGPAAACAAIGHAIRGSGGAQTGHRPPVVPTA